MAILHTQINTRSPEFAANSAAINVAPPELGNGHTNSVTAPFGNPISSNGPIPETKPPAPPDRFASTLAPAKRSDRSRRNSITLGDVDIE